jgi:drug/metabolite transporter (DMT)-like permease
MSAVMVWLLVGINVLWGGSSLAAKVALGTEAHPQFPPMTLAFARFSMAAVLMYSVALWLRVDLAVSRRDWGRFWAMGVLGLAATYLLGYVGIRQTTASEAALIIATEPVFLVLLSFFFWRERLSVFKIGGIAAGLAGVYLVIADGWTPAHLSGAIRGDLLIAAGLIFEASSSIVGKGLVARYPTVTVMTYQMATGSLTLAPFAASELIRAAQGGHPSALPSVNAWLSLTYLVLPCTVLAYTVWFMILDKRGAGEMSVFLFIQPVVGMLLGVCFLHDALTAFKVGGALLVLLGIGLINRRPFSPKMPTNPPSA